MSTQGLDNMARRMLKRVNTDLRKKVVAHQGQIFIWRKKDFEEAMAAHASPSQVKALSTYYHNQLVKAETAALKIKSHKARLEQAKLEVIERHIDGFNLQEDEVFAVKSYSTVQRIKGEVGSFFKTLTGKSRSIVTGQGNKEGQQVGHGEFGHAVSTTMALASEAVLESPSSRAKFGHDPAYERLRGHIETYKKSVDIDLTLDHYMDLTVRGGFKKTYTPILSSQDSILNAEEGKEEKRLLGILREAIEAELDTIVKQKGSPSLEEGVRDIMLHNLTDGGRRKHKGKGKPKTSVKAKGRGKASSSTKLTKKVNIISGAGATQPDEAKAAKGVSSMPLFLLGVLNDQLPETVEKNMHSPRLQNQTGRFAGSVRVTDISPTGRGFPSIGYTYQRSPYEVFEQGNRQGSVARDPRRLIDYSIREIAAQYAIGRFYTRRM